MIRLGKLDDLNKINLISKACAKHMINNSIHQWNDHYPNPKIFKKDIGKSELYVYELENTILGCIVITTLVDAEYIPVKWLTPNNKNIYVHRLAIHPDYQGKGYAQVLMDFAEKFANENNYFSIRLDAYSQNKRVIDFYKKRKYFIRHKTNSVLQENK